MSAVFGSVGGRTLKLGIAVGGGTGAEVRAAFEAGLGAFADACGVEVRTLVCEHRFETFGGIAAVELSASEAAASSERDAARYGEFLHQLAAAGAPAVFRTAINAQPLYAVREQFGGIKVEVVPNDGGELLLVRDEAQGFYAGSNDSPDNGDRLVRTCVFSREVTERVLDAAWSEAMRHFGERERIDQVALAYKFHLLDRRFAIWVSDWSRTRGVELSLWQPDTVNRQLRRDTFRGNVLLVGSNEWGDIMHEELVSRAGLGSQDEHCSRNIYTAPELGGLVEHQTVHGSADDIAGRALVNPTAALRAAATILEEHADAEGIRANLEAGLTRTRALGVATPDAGGRASTDEVTRVVIEQTLASLQERIEPTGAVRSDEALVIIDLQNDFCAAGGRFADLGLIDPDRTTAVADVAGRLVRAARAEGVPVVFVHTHADPDAVPPNVLERHRREGRIGYLCSGEWGAEPFGPVAEGDETVVTKALYDPFLGSDFETTLETLGVRRLVLAGVFADVCVDATARTAFQKGLDVSIVSDGTLGLERSTADALSFMKRYYGARIATAREIAASWAPSRESHIASAVSAPQNEAQLIAR
jgi:nicotinamidase-related amidase/isocitrate/isopropylmalate dehydrogenase